MMVRELLQRVKGFAALLAVKVIYYIGMFIIGGILVLESLTDRGRVAVAAYAFVGLSDLIADFGTPSELRTI